MLDECCTHTHVSDRLLVGSSYLHAAIYSICTPTLELHTWSTSVLLYTLRTAFSNTMVRHVRIPKPRSPEDVSAAVAKSMSKLDFFTVLDANVFAESDNFALPSPTQIAEAQTREQLQQAVTDGDISSVREIIEQAASGDIGDARLEESGHLIYLALMREDLEMMQSLLRFGAKANTDHAYQATLKGHVPMLELLLQHGWDINEPMGTRPPPFA
jgi:hypothetical protein